MSNNKKSDTNQLEPINDGKKRISIAMQGGGAHGAFTWGVLDRLLQEKDIFIEGVSGTSAGGMNAVATAQGIIQGGNEGGRQLLDKYWQVMSDAGRTSIFKPGVKDILQNKYTMYNSPGFLMFDFMSKIMSPYQMNPSGADPLKDVINQLFDFDLLKENNDLVKVFLAATHVYTGKIKIFGNKELCVDALLATACLPTIHAAVMVNGEYYWDGGFIANPAIYPLIYECHTADVMIIKLNPTHRNRLPTTAVEIGDRLNEITNNTSIVREMRSIHFITKLIDQGLLERGRMKRLNVHLIEDEAVFQDLGWSSKLNTDMEFLQHLRNAGRIAADKWLTKNYDKIGKEGTADVAGEFV
ncbi:alpha/beta hydrolase [Alphaproteobacteria bacterium]|nr:alpha/beta hydrolase [Alphaproteobacteria bacterium]